jgi:hypothetical protein
MQKCFDAVFTKKGIHIKANAANNISRERESTARRRVIDPTYATVRRAGSINIDPHSHAHRSLEALKHSFASDCNQ